MTRASTIQISWTGWRIIPSRNPPVDLYQRIAPREDWKAIIEVETLTNPRVRELREGLGLVRPEDLKGGATQNWIIAPFTYVNPEGSRFSDGTFGVNTQSKELATALVHSIRLRENFLSRTNEAPVKLDMRVLKTKVAGEFDDVSNRSDLDDLAKSRAFGKARREAGSDGILYASDIRRGEHRLAALRPRVLSNAIQERHLTYSWNGRTIDGVYDFGEGKFIDLDALFKGGALAYLNKGPVGRSETVVSLRR